jgi:hypothetical protein
MPIPFTPTVPLRLIAHSLVGLAWVRPAKPCLIEPQVYAS